MGHNLKNFLNLLCVRGNNPVFFPLHSFIGNVHYALTFNYSMHINQMHCLHIFYYFFKWLFWYRNPYEGLCLVLKFHPLLPIVFLYICYNWQNFKVHEKGIIHRFLSKYSIFINFKNLFSTKKTKLRKKNGLPLGPVFFFNRYIPVFAQWTLFFLYASVSTSYSYACVYTANQKKYIKKRSFWIRSAWETIKKCSYTYVCDMTP